MGTLAEQGRAVLAAAAAGELGPGQGAQLLAAIGALAKVAVPGRPGSTPMWRMRQPTSEVKWHG